MSGTVLASVHGMTSKPGCETRSGPVPSSSESGAKWDRAARNLDAVAAALFEGNYLEALRLARLAKVRLAELSG